MSRIKKAELDTLEAFFRTVGAHYGLWNRGTKNWQTGYTTNAIFQKNLEILRDLESKGVPYHEIADNCRKAAGRRPLVKCKWINEMAPLSDHPKTELIGRSIFLHRLTKNITPATSTTPPSVSNKESFTLGELTNYFCQTFDLCANATRKQEYASQFVYLLKIYNLDAVLFMIDLAKNADQFISDVFKLKNLEDDVRYEILHRTGGRKNAWLTEHKGKS